MKNCKKQVASTDKFETDLGVNKYLHSATGNNTKLLAKSASKTQGVSSFTSHIFFYINKIFLV